MLKGEKKDVVFNKEEKKIIFHNVMFVLSLVLCKEGLGQPLRA